MALSNLNFIYHIRFQIFPTILMKYPYSHSWCGAIHPFSFSVWASTYPLLLDMVYPIGKIIWINCCTSVHLTLLLHTSNSHNFIVLRCERAMKVAGDFRHNTVMLATFDHSFGNFPILQFFQFIFVNLNLPFHKNWVLTRFTPRSPFLTYLIYWLFNVQHMSLRNNKGVEGSR